MLWLIFAVICLLALGLLLPPLLRAGAGNESRGDYDLVVYRRQLSELEADAARGLIDGEALSEARREIEHRILNISPSDGAEMSGGRSWRRPTAMALAGGLPLAAFLIYGQLGAPSLPGQPLAERHDGETAVAGGSEPLPEMVAELAERMRRQPGDARGWRLLGRSYLAIGRYAEAANAFSEALALDATDNVARVSMAEALTLAGSGTVTPAARATFQAALEAEPANPRARYYLGLAAWQAGRPQAAYDRWLALARDAPPEAPWLDIVLRRLANVAPDLGIDLATELPSTLRDRLATGQPAGPSDADVEAAAELSPEERQEFIRSMVARLASRLESAPDDFDGWMQLGRAYRVLGDAAAAANAYGKAASLRPDDPAPLGALAGSLMDVTDPNDPPPAAAMDAYSRLLKVDPDNPEALWFTGLADAQAGRVKAAILAWQRLLAKLDPESQESKTLAEEIRKARGRLE